WGGGLGRVCASKSRLYCLVVFFFQAEDGIRDDLVTGVQTCALPIYGAVAVLHHARARRGGDEHHRRRDIEKSSLISTGAAHIERSEERRVGKECRSRWWRDHETKK